MLEIVEQICRECGCTQNNACPNGCWWVEEDLCSDCTEISHYPLEKEVYSRVSKLEYRTYRHSDNAVEMSEQILELVRISEVKNEKIKRAIALEGIRLLECYRFE
jgi:hypothetical protein